MGGGVMWRTVSRVVGSTPTTAASNAAMCRMCTTAPSLKAPTTSARMACGCSGSSEVHNPNGQANSGLQQYWEMEDWVFAGDEAESLDYLVFGTVPSKQDVEEATSDLQHALQIGLLMGRDAKPLSETASRDESVDVSVASAAKGDREDVGYHVIHPVSDSDWKEPAPLELASSSCSSSIKEVVGGNSISGGNSSMLEAFHQFQHNPQVQKMVVSLATDKSVWDAVLGNEQIIEFRQKLRESTGLIGSGSEEVTVAEVSKALNEDTGNIFSHVFWNTTKAFTQFMTTLQELIRGIFDVTEEKLKITDDTDAFFERTVRSTMMLSVLVMSLVVFKRGAPPQNSRRPGA